MTDLAPDRSRSVPMTTQTTDAWTPLETLLEAATPGPWFGPMDGIIASHQDRDPDAEWTLVVGYNTSETTPDNAALIVAAVDALPALIEDARRGAELRELLREAIEVVHQSESIRRHADPNDKTGWNVHGIETCADPLCVASLAALTNQDETKGAQG